MENILSGIKSYYGENKPMFIILLTYSIILATICIIEILKADGFYGWSLYPYFDYVSKVHATPFIDFRSGYPPVGLLPYYPLFKISDGVVSFQLYFTFVNVGALTLSMFFIYLVLSSAYSKANAIKSIAIITSLPFIAMVSFYSSGWYKTLYGVYVLHAVEPLSLLFMTVSLYCMIVRRTPTLTGLFIGIGFMTKIYPILLLIPAIAFFRSRSDALKLLYTTFASTLIISLPFLILDPLMYATVFLHHATRGPSNTIYALIEGFYGHTGLLHPAFDQFLYYWQLVKVYPPRTNDHAFYLWKNPSLPIVLFVCQVAALVACYLLLRKHSDSRAFVKGSCLTILSFVFFSKLYSPHFAAFILPLVVISFDKFVYKVLFGVSLYVMHEIQGLLWSRNFYDLRFPLFTSEVIIRSLAILAVIVLLSYELIKGVVKG